MNDIKRGESSREVRSKVYDIWSKVYWEEAFYGFAIITVDEENNIDIIPSRDVLKIGSDGNEENKKYEKERSKE